MARKRSHQSERDHRYGEKKRKGGEGNGEATSDCSRQEDGRVGKVGDSSEEWGGSEAGGGTGVGGTERSNGRTREGDESGRLCGEGNGEATSDCSRQEDGRVGKVGGSSEEWGGSEAGGGTGAGSTERSNGRTREGDESVDCLRLRTLKGVLDVLNPLQCVEFLTGISMLQILLRQWGKKRACTIN
ncbi:hypothetical protein GH714_013715 [Hevea brasiliensis]|uniref:Uncharacterized protein n=1 Tax=Hevea brasiliensis TaxID=3981 RepID=A0A6A6LPX0_HEVBR|nr:hypothetical protein GH714_013715 [Hevea brasiliensis]